MKHLPDASEQRAVGELRRIPAIGFLHVPLGVRQQRMNAVVMHDGAHMLDLKNAVVGGEMFELGKVQKIENGEREQRFAREVIDDEQIQNAARQFDADVGARHIIALPREFGWKTVSQKLDVIHERRDGGRERRDPFRHQQLVVQFGVGGIHHCFERGQKIREVERGETNVVHTGRKLPAQTIDECFGLFDAFNQRFQRGQQATEFGGQCKKRVRHTTSNSYLF